MTTQQLQAIVLALSSSMLIGETSGLQNTQFLNGNPLPQYQATNQTFLTQTQKDEQTVVTQSTQAAETQTSYTEQTNVEITCQDAMTQYFYLDQNTPASKSFDSFVTLICPSLNLRIPNGVKVSTCFHTGYFLLSTLRPLSNAQNKADFDSYVSDFCTNYEQVLPQRTQFVKNLYTIQDAETFSSECLQRLDSEDAVSLNTWFDPIDPLSSITNQEICDLNFKLFESLRDKQRTSLSEYVSFSYLASLDLYLNAQQQEDYENCVNFEIVESPNVWISNYVNEHPAFLNWTQYQKSTIIGQTATKIESSCGTDASSCDGCAIGLAEIFKKYEQQLNQAFSDLFTKNSEQMFTNLQEANLAIETTN